MKYTDISCIALVAFFFSASFGCPFIITNDSDNTLIVVDPYNKQLVHINPGDNREIDPSIHGWHYYFYYEKLDFYVPRHDNPQLFYRHYQLVEKHCTEGKTKLTLNDVSSFTKKSTERFKATEFEPPEHDNHHH